ncbi:hypothetical protein RFI_33142, partial [Reticulomyxa filosa]
MEQQEVDGRPHICPTKVKNKALANVRSSSSTKSETRYITAVPIDLKEMGVYGDQDTVVLCDTPGFEDTSGPEVDVANGIGIIKALQNCKSVKPVVLITYTALGYRMNYIRELARTLVGIIPSIKDHLNTFSYVLTKFPDKEKQFFHAMVKDTLCNMAKDESNEGYKALLADIAKKTQKQVIAPNLLEDSPSELLEKLSDVQYFIQEPSEVFQPFITEKSSTAVRLQVEKHKSNILLAFKHHKYQSAKDKLDDLTGLNAVLKNDYIESDYNDCVKKLTQEWNEKIELAKNNLNKGMAAPHAISKEDVLAYKKTIDELKSADSLRSHLKDAISADALVQNLNDQTHHLISEIEKNMENEIALKVHLGKLAQVRNIFPNFAPVYKQACQTLANRLTNSVDTLKECIEKNKFEEVRKALEAIIKVLPLQPNLATMFDVKKEIKQLETLLMAHLNNVTDKGLVAVKRAVKDESASKKEEKDDNPSIRIDKLAKPDIELLEISATILEAATNVFEPPCEHFNLSKPTKELFYSFLNEIIVYFDKISQKITSLFEKQRYLAFDEIKGFVNVMDDLRKLKAVEQRTQRSYFQIIERIFGFVRDVQKDVDVMLPLLIKQDPSFDYNRLFECVGCVSRSKWIVEKQGGESTELMDTIKEKLIAHLCELQQSCQHLELDLDHPDHLEQGRRVVSHLDKLRSLEAIIPEISNYRKDIDVQIERAIRATLSTIENEFSLEKKGVNYQREVKEQLVKLKVYAESLTHANAFLQQKELTSAQDLDFRIGSIEDELKTSEKALEEKRKDFDNDIQKVQEKITLLEDIGFEYQRLAKKTNWRDKNIPQKAIDFLKEQGYKAIDEVESEEEKEKEKFEQLQERAKQFDDTQIKQIEELNNNLKKYQQIKKEFQKLQSKEKMAFENASEFLKSQDFSETEITRWMNNEPELVEKIKQYEREIEKFKNVGYNFGVLNAARTEKVLNYSKECKSTPFSFTDDQSGDKNQGTLKQDLGKALSSVEHYLRCYCEFVHNQLRSLDYTKILTVSKTDVNDFADKVETILNRLNEISKLEQNHPVIFAFFPQDMMKQLIGKLEKCWLDLSDEMMKLAKQSNLPALKSKIFVTKALSALDEYTKLNCKFRDLFMKYQEILFNDVIDTSKVFKAIEGHQYTEVAAEMSILNQRKDGDGQVEKVFEEVKGSLARFLKTLTKSTMMKVLMLGENEVELESVIQLEEQMQWIDDAKNFVFEYVDKKTQQEIEKIENETKSAIEKWMLKVLGTVKAAINSYNFREAEEKIRLVRKFTRILGNRFDQIFFGDNKEEKMQEGASKIVNRVDELEKQVESVLKGVVSKYKDIKLSGCQFSPYASNPPKDLYAKLSKVMESATTSNYKEAWTEIEEDITKKVRDLLLDARGKVSNSNSRESESCIRLCGSVLNSLPEHMQTILRDEVRQCRDDIKYEAETSLKEVEQVMQQKNAQDINELLDRCNINQEKTIKSGVDKMAREIVSRIDKQWIDEETSEALSSMEELYRFKNTFKKKMPDLDRYFVNARGSLSNINAAGDVNTDELLPPNFNEKIKELDNKISTYFTSLQQKYKKSIETMSAEELHAVLNTVKAVGSEGPFLQKVKTFMRKKSACGIPEDASRIITYSEITRDLTAHLEKMADETITYGIVNDKTKTNGAARERFFGQLKERLDFLKQVAQLKNHIPNTQKLESCEIILEKEAQEFVKKVTENKKWNSASCDQINLCYNCFVAMQKNGVLSNVVKPQLETIENVVKNRVEQLEKEAIGDLDTEHLTSKLVSMKEMSVYIFSFKSMVDKRIDELLGAYKRQSKGGMSVSLLALKLEKDPSGIGKMLVSEHNAFKGYNVALFNVKTQSHGIDHVLKRVEAKGDKIDAAKIEKKYEEFDSIYRKLIKEYLQEKPNLTTLVSNTKMITRGIEQKPDDVNWNATIRNCIPNLMAHIFALWTLQNAQFYFDAKGADNQDSYLLQPHAAQVVSIFRMLGIDENKLINNLIQIRTGEGKSVTLAIASSVLALLGFDVSCASYSDYLSCRDFKSFEPLFGALGITDHIHYGTFNKLCERIINDGGDVRKLVENMIMPNDDKKTVETSRVIRAKILLIDEVDVFFNKEFYGDCYSPAATLRHDVITNLIDYIWANRNSYPTLDGIRESEEYEECCNVLKEWSALLDEAIKDMLNDIQKFESHGYQVSNDKIGYKEQDSICYNIRYGYKTLFAYYYENEQNKISDESFKNNIFISFQIGNFSYAEVPKNFCCIMGVSGTLKTLSAPEQEVVEKDYHVSKHTYMPSLFGDNKLIFAEKKDILIVEECDYFTTLKKEIDDRLIGTNPATRRAVLVFFESKKQLMEFYESSNFLARKENAIIMTEENTHEEKEYLVKRATGSGQVGLFTRAFGRGTDFVCLDPIVAANGGVHVIQTFLSEELSEEVQIKGRTARQNSSGSYTEIDNARKAGNFYPLLDAKRTEFFKSQYAESKKYVEYAANEHKLGEELIAALKKNNVNAVKKMLCDRNKGTELEDLSRTIVLMDGTGSMDHLLQKAKNA